MTASSTVATKTLSIDCVVPCDGILVQQLFGDALGDNVRPVARDVPNGLDEPFAFVVVAARSCTSPVRGVFLD